MRIERLGPENCPDFIAVFQAATVNEALERIQKALLIEKKEAAVWLITDEVPLSESFNKQARQAHKQFLKDHPGENMFMKDVDFTSGCILTGVMSRRDIEIADYFLKAAELKVTKRIQITDPNGTVNAHLDHWVDSEEKLELKSPRPEKPFGGRRTRFLHTENGAGPIFWEKPDVMEIVAAETGRDGILVNTHDLKRGWQVPGNSLAAITTVVDWGCQASLHESPRVSTPRSNPRIQTLLEAKF